MANKPFTTLYDTIWTVLESDSSFTASVKAGNRIKVTDQKEKPGFMNADVPQVIILPMTGDGGVQSNKRGAISKNYVIIISSGDRQADTSMDIEWEVIRILTENLATFSALDNVRDINVVQSITQKVNEEIVKLQIKGYTSVVTIEAQFEVSR